MRNRVSYVPPAGEKSVTKGLVLSVNKSGPFEYIGSSSLIFCTLVVANPFAAHNNVNSAGWFEFCSLHGCAPLDCRHLFILVIKLKYCAILL